MTQLELYKELQRAEIEKAKVIRDAIKVYFGQYNPADKEAYSELERLTAVWVAYVQKLEDEFKT